MKKWILFSIIMVCILLGGCSESGTEVEISKENWEDYFEVKEIIDVEYNDFGEAEEYIIYPVIALKEEYEIDLGKSEVAIEYEAHAEVCYVDLDTETGEFVYEEKVRDTFTRYTETDTFSNKNFQTIDKDELVLYGIKFFVPGDCRTWIEEETQRRMTDRYYLDDVIRIEGSIYLK